MPNFHRILPREQVAVDPVRTRRADHGSRDGPQEPHLRRPARPPPPQGAGAARARARFERELEESPDILRRGNGADCQLRVYNANRDIVEVAREIADATEAAAD